MSARTLRGIRQICIQQAPQILAGRKDAENLRQLPSQVHAGQVDSRAATCGIKALVVEAQGSRNLLFGHEMPAALICLACREFLLMCTAPDATHTYGSR